MLGREDAKLLLQQDKESKFTVIRLFARVFAVRAWAGVQETRE